MPSASPAPLESTSSAGPEAGPCRGCLVNRFRFEPSEALSRKEAPVNPRLVLAAVPSLAACTVVESPIAASLSVDGLRFVDARLERGDFAYTGAAPHQLDVRGSAWGRASDEAVAQGRLEGVWFLAERQGSAAVVASGVTSSGAGADLTLSGPAILGLSVAVAQGSIEINRVRGHLDATADGIRVVDAVGSADLLAGWGGVTAELRPRPGDVVRIEAEGDIELRLPWGMPYDLQVWGDPDHQVVVSDLGFQQVIQDGPHLGAHTGSGSVRVDIHARDGDVRIEPIDGW